MLRDVVDNIAGGAPMVRTKGLYLTGIYAKELELWKKNNYVGLKRLEIFSAWRGEVLKDANRFFSEPVAGKASSVPCAASGILL